MLENINDKITYLYIYIYIIFILFICILIKLVKIIDYKP